MKILFAGDTVLTDDMQYSPEFIELAKKHDYCILNLEAPLTKQTNGITKAGPNIKSSPEHIDSLKKIFNCVTLANNHTMDYGTDGLIDCIDHLKTNNILYTGAGTNIDEALKPMQLGNCFIFSVCENEFGSASNNNPGVATFDYLRKLYGLIQKYKQQGTIIICYHGGSEIIPIPQRYIVDRFDLLMDFGASLIIAHHPHVVQGYRRNTFYSLGNFYFNNNSFSQYINADWSLVVSYDTETNSCVTHHASYINNTISLVDKNDEINYLNSLLNSEDYDNLSNIISVELFNRWYPNEFKRNIPVMLHYLRCDAHKNNIVCGLSRLLNEIKIYDSDKYSIEINNIDSFKITRK